jgi:beta-lactamase class A
MSDVRKAKFTRKLENAEEEFDGVMGISIKDLNSGDEFSVNGDERFMTASTIKIPVLIELFRKAKSGELDLDERVTISNDLKVGGSGVLKELGDGTETMTIRDLTTLMIIVSDNTATNIMIDIADMDDVNVVLEGLGLKVIRIRRKMQDYEAIKAGRENYATPREFTRLMEIIHTGDGLDPWVCEQVLEVLKKPKTTALHRLLPPKIKVASKSGDMMRSSCDVGIVYHPENPYIITVMTKHIPREDLRKQWAVADIATVSRMAYDYFNTPE